MSLGKWIKQGEEVTVHGIPLTCGMLYYGSTLKSLFTFHPDPALIDPSLPYTGDAHSNLTSYSYLAGSHRREYIHWLMRGRKGNAQGWFLKLFLFGLERHLLFEDNIQDSKEVILELKRVIDTYSDFPETKQLKELYELGTFSGDVSSISLLDKKRSLNPWNLSIKLGLAWRDFKIIPEELAYQAFLIHPDVDRNWKMGENLDLFKLVFIDEWHKAVKKYKLITYGFNSSKIFKQYEIRSAVMFMKNLKARKPTSPELPDVFNDFKFITVLQHVSRVFASKAYWWSKNTTDSNGYFLAQAMGHCLDLWPKTQRDYLVEIAKEVRDKSIIVKPVNEVMSSLGTMLINPLIPNLKIDSDILKAALSKHNMENLARSAAELGLGFEPNQWTTSPDDKEMVFFPIDRTLQELFSINQETYRLSLAFVQIYYQMLDKYKLTGIPETSLKSEITKFKELSPELSNRLLAIIILAQSKESFRSFSKASIKLLPNETDKKVILEWMLYLVNFCEKPDKAKAAMLKLFTYSDEDLVNIGANAEKRFKIIKDKEAEKAVDVDWDRMSSLRQESKEVTSIIDQELYQEEDNLVFHPTGNSNQNPSENTIAPPSENTIASPINTPLELLLFILESDNLSQEALDQFAKEKDFMLNAILDSINETAIDEIGDVFIDGLTFDRHIGEQLIGILSK